MQLIFVFMPLVLAAHSITHEIRSMAGNRFTLEVFKPKLWGGQKLTFVFDQYRGVINVNQRQPERSSVRFGVEFASTKCVGDLGKTESNSRLEKAAIQDTMVAPALPENTFPSPRDQSEIV